MGWPQQQASFCLFLTIPLVTFSLGNGSLSTPSIHVAIWLLLRTGLDVFDVADNGTDITDALSLFTASGAENIDCCH